MFLSRHIEDFRYKHELGRVHYLCICGGEPSHARFALSADTKDEVAYHLTAGTITTVPKVVAYDSTSSIPYLKRPFILCDALLGEDAWQLAKLGYTAENRFGVAIELAAIVQKIPSKGLRKAGCLIADSERPASAKNPDARKPRVGIKPFARRQSNERLTLQRFAKEMLIIRSLSLSSIHHPAELRAQLIQPSSLARLNLDIR